MTLTPDEIQKYSERKFSIDCPRMLLRQNTESPERTYDGPGSIYQTADGDLMFKLYANGPRDASFLRRMLGAKAPKSGELVATQEYFWLEATTMTGATWRSEYLLPDFSQGAGNHGPIVTGSMRSLVSTVVNPYSTDQRPYLTLRFAEDFNFPANVNTATKKFLGSEEIRGTAEFNAARFEAVGVDFQLWKDDGFVLLSAESKGLNLPEHLGVRICEALEFAMFQPTPWIVKSTFDGTKFITTLRPFSKECTKRASIPPINFQSHPNAEAVWNLFTTYLKYIVGHPQTDLHPLSAAVHLSVEGAASNLELGLLSLSVAVESVLKAGFSEISVPDDLLRDQIETARRLFSNSGLEVSFRNRLEGALGAMNTPRAKDKLLSLAGAGLIRKDLMQAWEAIRNPSVHADTLNPNQIDKIYRDYQSAQTLFNELVFLAIGYKGSYTDYSVTGWPLRSFEATMKAPGLP